MSAWPCSAEIMMRILTVAPDQYERHQNALRQMHRHRATVLGGRLYHRGEKNVTSTMIADRLIFCQLPTVERSQVAFVSFQLLVPQCWSRPSPSFSMQVRFALIQAWSRARASASIRPCPLAGDPRRRAERFRQTTLLRRAGWGRPAWSHPDGRSLRCDQRLDRRGPRKGRARNSRAEGDAGHSGGGGSWLRPGLSPPHLLQDVLSRDLVAVAQILKDLRW